MLLKILGALDLVFAMLLIFGTSFDLPWRILWIIGIILILKSSMGMLKDFASWIDFLSGVTFLLWIIVDIPGFIGVIMGLLLMQKAAFSFF